MTSYNTDFKRVLLFQHPLALDEEMDFFANRKLFFLQRVSIACYAERCTRYSKSVRLSVRPSVRHCVKTTPATIMQSSL